jgi:hypothetical protein
MTHPTPRTPTGRTPILSELIRRDNPGFCAECQIRIFDDQADAAAAGVTFYHHINGSYDGRCPDCANLPAGQLSELRLLSFALNPPRYRPYLGPRDQTQQGGA